MAGCYLQTTFDAPPDEDEAPPLDAKCSSLLRERLHITTARMGEQPELPQHDLPEEPRRRTTFWRR